MGQSDAGGTPSQTLVTGFGPFGTVASNPTERLVQRLRLTGAPGHELTLCVLPVSYSRARMILEALLEVGGAGGRPFDAVLLLGVAVGSAHWRVERCGRNGDDPRPDEDGFTPGGPILPGGAEVLASTFPAERIVAAIQEAGLPAAASDSAGGYLCNHLLFRALHWLGERGHPARAGFLHVPADEFTLRPGIASATLFPFHAHVRALHTALSALTQRREEGETGD